MQRLSPVISSRRISIFVALLFALLSCGRMLAAQAYIIVDSKNGYIFQEQNSKAKRQVGSLTKIAMAMVVLDWAEKHSGDLGQVATVPPEAFNGVTENFVGFQPGDTATLRDLLYAALVQSDNIAAYTLANHVGQQITSLVSNAAGPTPVATFVGQMNALAKTLRMERTHFVNSNGLDSNEKSLPYSTAADLARLTRYAMDRAGFRFYVSQKERQVSFNRGGKSHSYQLRNTNELLGTNGVEGVKTGRTARAGDCLILSAQRQAEIVKLGENRARIYPRHLIIVMLGSTNRFPEGQQLLNLGWQLYDQWAAAGRLVDPKKTL